MQKVKEEVWELKLGANYQSSGETTFTVWAPHHSNICLKLEGDKAVRMEKDALGYFSITHQASPGDLYFYQLENGSLRPDPVSRLLPKGVHGPTQVVDPSYTWHDEEWKKVEMCDALFYELHVGTFTERGTFESIIDRLDYLVELGVNVIELMPITQFPGRWNWGYDGVSLYAPCHTYGGPLGLKRLVDMCHKKGIAVCLDVVYNHLGPEGNILNDFGPYFHNRYHTPWGKALNYDSAYSNEVRRYIIDNARYWVEEYHIDFLRLDAVHGIFDFSAHEMLHHLVEEVSIPIIAENELNDCRYLRTKEEGGWEFAALWNDDYHHAIHAYLTGENHIYYADFGTLDHITTCLKECFYYTGKYSKFRKRDVGNSAEGIPLEKFICFIQNHDQVGNRPLSDRLSTLISSEKLKVAATLNILSPMTPMLFMGEEYGETNPFDYFVDFSDEKLMRSIYEGRKREFRSESMPFPGKESYMQSRLTWKTEGDFLQLYKTLIALRKEHPPRKGITSADVTVHQGEDWLAFEYPTRSDKVLAVLAVFKPMTLELPLAQREVLFSTQNITKKWNFEGECATVLV
ncbi:MAG: malto-oligosyltrehalose trehalohydrolase [Chlamydiales bacterium]|nr:malto-oligosyltrehalose trehalohydrolase [Chlamydiales bacterium]